MLHFFKKTNRTNNEEKLLEKEDSPSTISDTVFDDRLKLDEFSNIERSKLSKNLLEIISDQNCICYFVQFLETKNAIPLIKFYLDAENFKTVSNISQIYLNEHRVQYKTNYYQEDVLLKERLNSKLNKNVHCDNLKATKVLSNSESETFILKHSDNNSCNDVKINFLKESSNKISKNIDGSNSVPELENLCYLSMRKPITDDEKFQIFAETNKIEKSIKKNTSSLKLSTEENFNKFNSSVTTDAFRIYKKYLVSNSQYFIDIPATIISNISLTFCSTQINNKQVDSDCDDDKDDNKSKVLNNNHVQLISSNCFEEAKRYVFDLIEKEYLNNFLESNFYYKYCLDILTSLDLQLSDILYNELALFYFMEYLEQENHRNYLEFWMAATNFRRHYKCALNSTTVGDNEINSTNVIEVRSDAMILYEKYFSLQAVSPLEIADNTRCVVEESICSENPENIWKCFDIPLKIIEKDFECNYFRNFLKSQLFTNYLNELRKKLKDYTPKSKTNALMRKLSSSPKRQNIGNINGGIDNRKTMSDYTNENTKIISNTLLATGSNFSKSKNTNNAAAATATDMQIDTKHLTNPDLLWQRNSTSGGLIFGRVDKYGRYERNFEMETTEDKWSLTAGSNKIKNAVRKLIKIPEEKVQEELAWQVAELIVKDVTSVTLGKNSNMYKNINVEKSIDD